jgi:hypothetical protein
MLEWFNGNRAALDLYQKLVFIAHLWDDLIDKDKEVNPDDINQAFEFALVHIPTNAFYRQYFDSLSPLIYSGVMGYLVANKMEKSSDPHQVEIAHYLRYAIANIVSFSVGVLNTREDALRILPEAWKQMMPERIDEYMKEHLQ